MPIDVKAYRKMRNGAKNVAAKNEFKTMTFNFSETVRSVRGLSFLPKVATQINTHVW